MRRFAALLGALAAILAATGARAADVPAGAKVLWTRDLAPYPQGAYLAALVLPLPGGGVLLRSGAAVLAVDARKGATRWSFAGVDGASAMGTMVLLRRASEVLAVRARDGAVLWTRPCAKPPYAIFVGTRALTMCGGRSVVLNASSGRILAQSAVSLATSPPNIRGARALTDRYALVSNFFDGAWMGDAEYVVDATTGAFGWSATDFEVLDVTPSTIDITPSPSMLPWGVTGTVVRRRLSDGVTVARYGYAVPAGDEREGRGTVTRTRAATYVSVLSGPLLRYRGRTLAAPVLILDGADVAATIGSSAFIQHQYAPGHFELLLDRTDGRGGFTLQSLGTSYQQIFDGTTVEGTFAARAGNRVFIVTNGMLTGYDASGKATPITNRPCLGTRRIASSGTTLFVLCERSGTAAPSIEAYASPER